MTTIDSTMMKTNSKDVDEDELVPPHRKHINKEGSHDLNKNLLNLLGVPRSDRPQVDTSFVAPTLFHFAHDILNTEAGSKLYVGPKSAASERALKALHEANVVAIVNCTETFPCHHPDDFRYCRIAIPDAPWANLTTYLEGATTFIHAMIERGSVLVHCEQGMSRSAAVAMAYLMRFHKMTRDDAYLQCKTRRPMVSPNEGFWKQLGSYELALVEARRETRSMELSADEDCFKIWTRRTQALFETCSGIPQVLEAQDCWNLLGHVSNDEVLTLKLLTTCLDFIWGRGINDGDIAWLQFICDRFPSPILVRTMLSSILTDPHSDFSESWAGEIAPKDIKRILDALD